MTVSLTRSCAVLAIVGIGALTLSACALTTAPAVETTTVAAAAPLPVEGYDWHFHQDGDDASLAYGVEASDELKLGLDCRRASGVLMLSAVAPEDAKPEIHLESGGETERFAAEAEPSMLDDGVFLSAETRTQEPVFRRFRQVGWLALWSEGERVSLAPHPQSAGLIDRFFTFCG